MANLFQQTNTTDIILRLGTLIENDPRGIAEKVEKIVLEQLAEAFLKKYKDGILGAINADDIAYKLNDAVAELVRRKLLGETNERS